MSKVRFSKLLRLVWIDARLSDGWSINRADIMGAFGVSRPQASNDLTEYRRRFPALIRYDKALKQYRRPGGIAPPAYMHSARMAVLRVVEAIDDLRADGMDG